MISRYLLNADVLPRLEGECSVCRPVEANTPWSGYPHIVDGELASRKSLFFFQSNNVAK